MLLGLGLGALGLGGLVAAEWAFDMDLELACIGLLLVGAGCLVGGIGNLPHPRIGRRLKSMSALVGGAGGVLLGAGLLRSQGPLMLAGIACLLGGGMALLIGIGGTFSQGDPTNTQGPPPGRPRWLRPDWWFERRVRNKPSTSTQAPVDGS